jgi:hypothetical protein
VQATLRDERSSKPPQASPSLRPETARGSHKERRPREGRPQEPLPLTH